MKRALALLICTSLAACGDGGDQAAGEKVSRAQANQSGQADQFSPGQDIGTPNEDRIATLGFMNKRNNITRDLVMKTGESREIGNVIVRLDSCERSLPWEQVQETGAFVQVKVNERFGDRDKAAWHTVFSGWLFKNSPSLNVVEHPIYDVWVKDCAMNFPGEVAKPARSASSSSAP